jgi:hypothetical protein
VPENTNPALDTQLPQPYTLQLIASRRADIAARRARKPGQLKQLGVVLWVVSNIFAVSYALITVRQYGYWPLIAAIGSFVFSFECTFRIERDIDRFGRSASLKECDSLPAYLLPDALEMLKELSNESVYLRAFADQKREMLWGEYDQIRSHVRHRRIAQARETLYGIERRDDGQQQEVAVGGHLPVVARMENGVLKRRFDTQPTQNFGGPRAG